VIDPRDTRSVLGMCLSVIDAGESTAGLTGASRYGVYRM